MNIPILRTVSFSGHRSSKLSASPSLFATQGVNSVKERLSVTIRSLYADGYRYFLCGMAEGFDITAGETVLEMRAELRDIELIAVIPYRGHIAYAPSVRDRYQSLLDGAFDRVTVCGEYSYDCFHRRNDYLVNNSSVLVCLYNGSPGGTRYTVKKALNKGLHIINVADDTV